MHQKEEPGNVITSFKRKTLKAKYFNELSIILAHETIDKVIFCFRGFIDALDHSSIRLKRHSIIYIDNKMCL